MMRTRHGALQNLVLFLLDSACMKMKILMKQPVTHFLKLASDWSWLKALSCPHTSHTHAHLFISSVVTWYWYLLSSLQSSSSSISLKLWQSLTKYLKTNIKHHMHDFVQVFPNPLVLLHVLNPLVLLHVLTPLVLFDVLSLLLFLLVLVVTSSPGRSKFWILTYSHMGHCTQPGITLHWFPSRIGPRKITWRIHTVFRMLWVTELAPSALVSTPQSSFYVSPHFQSH